MENLGSPLSDGKGEEFPALPGKSGGTEQKKPVRKTNAKRQKRHLSSDSENLSDVEIEPENRSSDPISQMTKMALDVQETMRTQKMSKAGTDRVTALLAETREIVLRLVEENAFLKGRILGREESCATLERIEKKISEVGRPVETPTPSFAAVASAARQVQPQLVLPGTRKPVTQAQAEPKRTVLLYPKDKTARNSSKATEGLLKLAVDPRKLGIRIKRVSTIRQDGVAVELLDDASVQKLEQSRELKAICDIARPKRKQPKVLLYDVPRTMSEETLVSNIFDQNGLEGLADSLEVFRVLREEFRAVPSSIRVAQGETALLECGPPRGHPEPTVYWKKNGHLLELDNSKRVQLVDGGNLAIQSVREEDEGRYQCVAKNTVGLRESPPAQLKVDVKPFLIRGPEDVAAAVGGSVTLSCVVGGDPVPDVLWRRSAGGGSMPLGRVTVLPDRSLRLEPVALDDEGEYTCDVDNAIGSLVASAVLTVYSPPVMRTPPGEQEVEEGADAVFVCDVEGKPEPAVFWSLEGNHTLVFPGESLGRLRASLNTAGHTVLTVQDVQKADSGLAVLCAAVNTAGSDSVRARLSVISPEDMPPPVIEVGPANQTLPLYTRATLHCTASGNPPPVVTWYKDGVPILKSASRINITDTGSLQINDTIETDEGVYTCVASSRSGKATWSAILNLESRTNPNAHFYRGAELTTLPGPPSRPTVVNSTHNSMTISWTRNNKIGSSSLLGYQVEMFSRDPAIARGGGSGWIVVARRVSGPTYTQHHLGPALVYTFLVRAENSHGLSPPSPLSAPTLLSHEGLRGDEDHQLKEAQASLSAGHVVELTTILPTSATSIKLGWEIVNADFVEGFYIYSRSLDTNTKSTNILTVLHAGEASGFLVTGLLPFTRYLFFLIPFFKSVDGRPSNSRTARTMEDVPTEPPEDMQAVLLNSTAVSLKWKPPPPQSCNGIIRSYQIVVRAGPLVLSNVSVAADSPSLLLTNLTAGVVYVVEAAAVTRVGAGPFSAPATLRLDPTTPYNRRPVGLEQPVTSTSEFVTETWFVALLGSLLTVMLLLFAAMLIVRRRQMLAKKSNLPDCRTSGGMLATPVSLKGGLGLPLPLSGQPEASLWIEPKTLTQPRTTPDYAEVQQQSVSSFQPPTDNSPAAYATTTLVPSKPQGRDRGYCLESSREPLYSPPSYQSRLYSDTYCQHRNTANREDIKSNGSLPFHTATLRRPTHHSPMSHRPLVPVPSNASSTEPPPDVVSPMTHRPLQWRVQSPPGSFTLSSFTQPHKPQTQPQLVYHNSCRSEPGCQHRGHHAKL